MKKILLLCLLFLVVYSCTKDKNAATDTKTDIQTTDITTLSAFLARSMHVDAKSVSYNKADNAFYIDGDIVVSKKEAENEYQFQYQNQKSASTLQRRESYLVTTTSYSLIRIYSTMSESAWNTALDVAIAKWNEQDTPIQFVRVYSGSYDILAYEAPMASNIAGEGDPPAPVSGSVNRPGTFIRVNQDYLTSINPHFLQATLNAVVMHELGHAIGFAHTDTSEGTYISGTPTTDGISIMINGTGNSDNFSSGDIQAMNILYPSPNQTLPINGDDAACISNTKDYSINAPSLASVTWSISGTGGTIPTGSTGNSVVVTTTGNGDLYLSATVSMPYHTFIVPTKSIHIGPPSVTWGISTNCDGQTAVITANLSPGTTITSVTYRTENGNTPMSEVGTNQYELPPYTAWIDYTLVNSCGTTTGYKRFLRQACN